MENGFKVHVSGITKNEYMAAARWLSLNKIVPIAILAVAAAICLVVFGSGDRPCCSSRWWPSALPLFTMR